MLGFKVRGGPRLPQTTKAPEGAFSNRCGVSACEVQIDRSDRVCVAEFLDEFLQRPVFLVEGVLQIHERKLVISPGVPSFEVFDPCVVVFFSEGLKKRAEVDDDARQNESVNHVCVSFVRVSLRS